ncbi:hypothetical protein A2Y68_00155 [Candidatus Woesebacteria bacterium RBG_13_46_13]|uniref:Methyltransferase type 11 domain-containing protein n=1 Tax=Candidatus Woesebacteria bacterium RBG_13_46_13 TaxID=1802479 RepID=A0A1F7X2Q0_9BACT|nr:MAG: hypothetical protein A2Y68_00155 [Candidatus Woesebacteria bacterium RBG_13_46_13]
MSKSKRLRIHLGCGTVTPSGWINIDGSLNARFGRMRRLRKLLGVIGIIPQKIANIKWNKSIIIHDVRKRLPFRDNSVVAIYSSHLLEHLYLDDADRLLIDCHRILIKGGILRLMVPDLRKQVLSYLGETKEEEIPAADSMMNKMRLRTPTRRSGNIFYQILLSLQDFHTHKWMYDEDSLRHHLLKAGFKNILKKKRLSSRIDGISKVEKNYGLILEAEKQATPMI